MTELYLISDSTYVDITSKLLSINDDILCYRTIDIQNDTGVSNMYLTLPDINTCPLESFSIICSFNVEDSTTGVTLNYRYWGTTGSNGMSYSGIKKMTNSSEVLVTFSKNDSKTDWNITYVDDANYEIYDYYDLYNYSILSNSGRFYNAILMNNLDTNTSGYGDVSTWKQIGYSSDSPYVNTFDGDNKYINISNLTFTDNYQGTLFNYLVGGNINSLKVTGTPHSSTSNYRYVGGIAAGADASTISGCTCSFDDTFYTGGSFGGICYETKNTANVEYCTVSGAVSSVGNNTHGGITAVSSSDTIISNCNSSLNIYTSTGNTIGGVVGSNYGNISGCTYTGSITGSYRIGGIVGVDSNSGDITECEVSNLNITSNDGTLGGIAGGMTAGNISNCKCSGTINITGGNYGVGGIVGTYTGGGNSNTISGCSVELSGNSNISGTDRIGGLVGSFGSSTASLENSYIKNTSGNLTIVGSSNSVGGLVGTNYSNGTISSCSVGYDTNSSTYNYNITITGGWGVGGLIGDNNGVITGNGSDGFTNYCNAYVTSVNSTQVSTGNTSVGGLIGRNSRADDTSTPTISYCYNWCRSVTNYYSTSYTSYYIGYDVGNVSLDNYVYSWVAGQTAFDITNYTSLKATLNVYESSNNMYMYYYAVDGYDGSAGYGTGIDALDFYSSTSNDFSIQGICFTNIDGDTFTYPGDNESYLVQGGNIEIDLSSLIYLFQGTVDEFSIYIQRSTTYYNKIKGIDNSSTTSYCDIEVYLSSSESDDSEYQFTQSGSITLSRTSYISKVTVSKSVVDDVDHYTISTETMSDKFI